MESCNKSGHGAMYRSGGRWTVKAEWKAANDSDNDNDNDFDTESKSMCQTRDQAKRKRQSAANQKRNLRAGQSKSKQQSTDS